MQQEFTDNLIGVKPDDSRSFVVDYPADFSSQPLAGKKVEYTTEVTAVRKKELPEVDEEWVKSLGGDFESVDAFKTKVREDLEARARFESDRNLRDDVIKKLLDAHQFEVPQSLVEQQTQARLEGVARQMMGRGVDPRSPEINWERAHAELQVQAEEDVRATMLLEKIAAAENIAVSDEEIEQEIEALATASRQSIEQVRAALTKDGGERSIAHRLRNRKALDLLIENATITDGEWKEPVTDKTDEGSDSSSE